MTSIKSTSLSSDVFKLMTEDLFNIAKINGSLEVEVSTSNFGILVVPSISNIVPIQFFVVAALIFFFLILSKAYHDTVYSLARMVPRITTIIFIFAAWAESVTLGYLGFWMGHLVITSTDGSGTKQLLFLTNNYVQLYRWSFIFGSVMMALSPLLLLPPIRIRRRGGNLSRFLDHFSRSKFGMKVSQTIFIIIGVFQLFLSYCWMLLLTFAPWFRYSLAESFCVGLTYMFVAMFYLYCFWYAVVLRECKEYALIRKGVKQGSLLRQLRFSFGSSRPSKFCKHDWKRECNQCIIHNYLTSTWYLILYWIVSLSIFLVFLAAQLLLWFFDIVTLSSNGALMTFPAFVTFIIGGATGLFFLVSIILLFNQTLRVSTASPEIDEELLGRLSPEEVDENDNNDNHGNDGHGDIELGISKNNGGSRPEISDFPIRKVQSTAKLSPNEVVTAKSIQKSHISSRTTSKSEKARTSRPNPVKAELIEEPVVFDEEFPSPEMHPRTLSNSKKPDAGRSDQGNTAAKQLAFPPVVIEAPINNNRMHMVSDEYGSQRDLNVIKAYNSNSVRNSMADLRSEHRKTMPLAASPDYKKDRENVTRSSKKFRNIDIVPTISTNTMDGVELVKSDKLPVPEPISPESLTLKRVSLSNDSPTVSMPPQSMKNVPAPAQQKPNEGEFKPRPISAQAVSSNDQANSLAGQLKTSASLPGDYSQRRASTKPTPFLQAQYPILENSADIPSSKEPPNTNEQQGIHPSISKGSAFSSLEKSETKRTASTLPNSPTAPKMVDKTNLKPYDSFYDMFKSIPVEEIGIINSKDLLVPVENDLTVEDAINITRWLERTEKILIPKDLITISDIGKKDIKALLAEMRPLFSEFGKSLFAHFLCYIFTKLRRNLDPEEELIAASTPESFSPKLAGLYADVRSVIKFKQVFPAVYPKADDKILEFTLNMNTEKDIWLIMLCLKEMMNN